MAQYTFDPTQGKVVPVSQARVVTYITNDPKGMPATPLKDYNASSTQGDELLKQQAAASAAPKTSLAASLDAIANRLKEAKAAYYTAVNNKESSTIINKAKAAFDEAQKAYDLSAPQRGDTTAAKEEMAYALREPYRNDIAAAKEKAATSVTTATVTPKARPRATPKVVTPKVVTPKNIYDGMTAEQIVAFAEAAAAAAGTAASSAAASTASNADTSASFAAGADATTAATAATVTANDATAASIDTAVAASQTGADAAIESATKVVDDITAFTAATDAENKRIDEVVDKNTNKEFDPDAEEEPSEEEIAAAEAADKIIKDAAEAAAKVIAAAEKAGTDKKDAEAAAAKIIADARAEADKITAAALAAAPKTVGTFVDPETGDVYALKDNSTKTLISLGTKKSDANTAAQAAADKKAADAYEAQMLKDAQTQEIKEERESAYEVLKTEFMKYDFDEDFISQVKNLILTGTPVSEATLKLRATDEYAIRFAGNQERKNAGKNVYDEATYLTLENQYRETFGAYGLDNLLGDKKTTRAKLAQYIGQDKSPVEIKKRIQMAVEQVQNRLDVRLMFDSYYPDITDKDLISYFLEPKETLASLENKVNISSIGSTAMRQGLIADYEVAKELSEMGVSEEQAAAGYKNVAGVLPDAKRLTSIEGGKYTQSEAESAYLKQTASEQRKLAKLAEREQARFASSSGVNKTSLTSSTMGQLY